MKLSFLLIVMTLNALPVSAGPSLIGGKDDYSRLNNGVLQLKFNDNGDFSACTATKISKTALITAAHCFHGIKPKEFGINTSTLNKEFNYSPIKIKKITLHPSYKKLSPAEADGYGANLFIPDIAVVEVIPNESFKRLKIVKVNFSEVPDGAEVEFWGYGCQQTINNLKGYFPKRKSFTSLSLGEETLHEEQGILSEFLKYYSSSIHEFNLITSGKSRDQKSSSLCYGDSGGPIMVAGQLVGINSNYTYNDIQKNGKTKSGVSYLNLHSRISKIEDWLRGFIEQAGI